MEGNGGGMTVFNSDLDRRWFEIASEAGTWDGTWTEDDTMPRMTKPLRLNFACGGSRWDGFDNSDTNREPGTTYVDLTQPPYPYPDESAELILISHGLFMGNHGVPLHPDLRPIMAEFFRILAPGGWLRIDDNPWRCYDGSELDPGQVAAELERGYKEEWRLPRGVLCGMLTEAGFASVSDVDPDETLMPFPDVRESILRNQMGHYSFTIEAQK